MDLKPATHTDGDSLSTSPKGLAHSISAVLVGLTFALVCVVFLFQTQGPPDRSEEQEPRPGAGAPKMEMFRGWPAQPDLALVISGQQFGFQKPCGCSEPQYGGLERRFNFIQSLKDKGWPVLAVDVGDVADEPAKHNKDLPLPPQAQRLIKYNTSLEALKRMGYSAISVGINEMRTPLSDCLTGFPLNNPEPRIVAANLLGQGPNGPFDGMVKPWEIGGGKNKLPRVGVLGWVAPSVEDQVKDPAVGFDKNSQKVLTSSLQDLAKQNPELVVLLYQGSRKEALNLAAWGAKQRVGNPAFPPINVIVHLGEFAEPPGVPEQVGDTLLINVGWKGKYVGVLGVQRTPNGNRPFQFNYQLVLMEPEYKTAEGKEANHPILSLLEEQAIEFKTKELYKKFPRSQHPTQQNDAKAHFVGSDACKGCHDHAFKVWSTSAHSHAYKSLVDATRPKNRQFDGECLVCHTVGFKYKDGFEDELNTGHLKNVGCESCHGPGSEHVAKPRNEKLYPLINPWKTMPAAFKMSRIDQFCQQCHDIDNDVKWSFQKTWPQVIHMTPRAQAVNGKNN